MEAKDKEEEFKNASFKVEQKIIYKIKHEQN